MRPIEEIAKTYPWIEEKGEYMYPQVVGAIEAITIFNCKAEEKIEKISELLALTAFLNKKRRDELEKRCNRGASSNC